MSNPGSAATTHRDVTALRKQLLYAGFVPIPVSGKVPSLAEWQKLSTTTDAEIELWPRTFPHAGNTGVLTRVMPTLDIDIKHQQASEAVETLIRKRFGQRGQILVRIGLAPKRAIPFRIDTPFKKITKNFLAPDASTDQKLEFLGDGQQLVAFGIHPVTRKPYQWAGGEPGQIKLEELPSITEAEARQLVDDAVELLAEFGYQPTQARPKNTNAGGAGSEDWGYLLANIRAGHELHDSTRDLAAKLVTAGMGAGAAVNLLRAAMQETQAPRDARWQARFNDLPSLVASAEEFIGAGSAVEQVTVAPVDLWGRFALPDLPAGLLPPVIEQYAIAQSEMMGCDAGGLAMAALTVCAATITDNIQLQMKQHDPYWMEPARLWTALVGPPSGMKTPILRQAARPLNQLDLEMHRDNVAAMEDFEALSADEKKLNPRPRKRRLRLEDTTIEAAQDTLLGSSDGVLCIHDELSGFFGTLDKYAGPRGAAKDRAFWMQAYNGGSYALDRISRGSAIIPNLSIAMLGGIQPEPLRKLMAEAQDDGLIQRLLPIILKTAVLGKDRPQLEVVNAYESLVYRLHKLRPPTIQGVGNLAGILQTVLRFDGAAQELRNKLEQTHLDLQAYEAINKKFSAHIGKYNGLFGRLCVLWHCIENSEAPEPPAVISFGTAQRVAAFLHEYLLPHAAAFYMNILGLSDDHDRLTAVADYIIARKLTKITNRDVQHGDRTMRRLTKRDVENVFEQLDALGWVSRVAAPRRGDPPHWIVNPEVHKRFAARAEASAKQREAIRRALRAAMGRG